MICYTDKHRVPFIVDDDDEVGVAYYRWYVGKRGYITTEVGYGRRPGRRAVPLHLFLLGFAPDGLEWDHINRDKFDNRRSNLRAVTHTQNRHNATINRNSQSGVIGVSPTKRGKWLVLITTNHKRRYVGVYDTLVEAKAARKAAEREDGRTTGLDGLESHAQVVGDGISG